MKNRDRKEEGQDKDQLINEGIDTVTKSQTEILELE